MATAASFVGMSRHFILTSIASVASVTRIAASGHVNSRQDTNVKFAVLITAVFCLAGGAQAQQVDVSKLKCKEFTELPKDTIVNVTLWLDGYLTDEEDPAVVDFDKMKGKADKLVSYCAQNPRLRIMTAAEEVLAK